MKKFLLMLIVLLMMLPMCAQAVTTVPDGITAVEAEAFANTDIDALIVPASVQTVGANVLYGTNASYLYLEGANTKLASGAANGVAFVFGPSNSSAASLSNFYPTYTLVELNGLYYSVTDVALPLCAKTPSSLSGTLTIPKLVNGKPVTSLGKLYVSNTGVGTIKVPMYLTVPSGLKVTRYETMTVSAPTANKSSVNAGTEVTWTTSTTGDYGSVNYVWTFEVAGKTSTVNTTTPSVKFTPDAAGTCKVSVTAEDSVGDSATASGQSVTVTAVATKPTYRAILTGNTYPGTVNQLNGPDNDIAAMGTMLERMTGTKYEVWYGKNFTAASILNGIATKFADAKAGDVSLFYFSGHGTSSGSLCGVNNTYISVYQLRQALDKIAGTKIVILDSCYSGMHINKSGEEVLEDGDPSAFTSHVISAFSSSSRSSTNLADEGYIVMTACRKNENSYSVGTNGGHYFGAFTYGVCYGGGVDSWHWKTLSGLPADTNGDKQVTLGEAYTKAIERINYLKSQGATWLSGMSAQYYGDRSFVLWGN